MQRFFFLRGAVITVSITVLASRTAAFSGWRRHMSPAIAIRVIAEVIGALAFLNALIRLPIANVTVILQVVPLAVALGAAMFLGETVGWRRYLAIGGGFVGVVIIVRPDAGGFTVFTGLALVAVLMMTIRDLATRRLAPEFPSVLVAFLTAISISATGLVISIVDGWSPIEPASLALVGGAAAFLSVGYLFSIKTVRVGDLSVAAPIRYTILLWAIILGILVFSEVPDAFTLAGSGLIILSGLYSVAREHALGSSAPRSRVFKNRPGV